MILNQKVNSDGTIKLLQKDEDINNEINDINLYVLNNSGKFIRSKIIFLYGLEIGVQKPKLVELY